MAIDRYDQKILSILQSEGRITKSALAERINLSLSPCWERVKRLEEGGIIQGYQAQIDTQALCKRTTMLIEFGMAHHSLELLHRFEAAMRDTPEVTECMATGGGVDYLAKVVVDDVDHYQRLVESWLASDLGIDQCHGYVVTKQIKDSPPSVPNVEIVPD